MPWPAGLAGGSSAGAPLEAPAGGMLTGTPGFSTIAHLRSRPSWRLLATAGLASLAPRARGWGSQARSSRSPTPAPLHVTAVRHPVLDPQLLLAPLAHGLFPL